MRDRAGLLTKIKPRLESLTFDRDRLYICEQLQCSPEMSHSYAQQARRTPNKMRQHMHQVVLTNWEGEPPLSARYMVEAQSSLDLKTLEDHDGVVYLEDYDLLVMYGLSEEDMGKIPHPYSIMGYTLESFQNVSQQNPYLRKGDFTFNIRIVDNHNLFGSRWILIGDTPICIAACKDRQVTDGIYITYSKNMLNGKGPQKLLTDRFDFTQGANLPYYTLYESQQEAMLARRSVQTDEARAKIQELESKAATAENNLKKAQQERDNLEREAQIRAQRHEQELEKLRRDRERMETEHAMFMEKQVSEGIMLSRKNTLEVIKCVPVLLSVFAAGAALLKKKE